MAKIETFLHFSKHCDLFVTFSTFPDDLNRSINCLKKRFWYLQFEFIKVLASSDHSEPFASEKPQKRS